MEGGLVLPDGLCCGHGESQHVLRLDAEAPVPRPGVLLAFGSQLTAALLRCLRWYMSPGPSNDLTLWRNTDHLSPLDCPLMAIQ